ncbi:MAG: hypothetical protein RL153_1205 [Verrucomicrobiota bacterium]|jgi:hypothetical protein
MAHGEEPATNAGIPNFFNLPTHVQDAWEHPCSPALREPCEVPDKDAFTSKDPGEQDERQCVSAIT